MTDFHNTRYRDIFRLAWPASMAASITPLLGTIDVWALGQSQNPLNIAAVGLAATIFSLAYWTFGFIRMSVAGLTAQAIGAKDVLESRNAFLRAACIGAVLGILMLLLQWPIGRFAFYLLGLGSQASTQTFYAAQEYFSIRIWGAPFALSTYACLGWLTARGRTDFLLLTGLIMTTLNICLDIVFVLKFQWGASGIALGTLLAEVIGALISFFLVAIILKKDGLLFDKPDRRELFRNEKIRRTLSINRDIFIRTGLLSFAFAWFVQRGSAFGDITLAANQVLLQLFLFTGLALDGTAIAAETLVGQELGQRHERNGLKNYMMIVRNSFIMASIGALLFTVFYGLLGKSIVGLLTPENEIFTVSLTYLPWVIISPMIVMVCFQLDGIFVGATQSREMRDSMIFAVSIFVPASIVLARYFDNHGLWLAFSLFFIGRAVTLWRYMPRIKQKFSSDTRHV